MGGGYVYRFLYYAVDLHRFAYYVYSSNMKQYELSDDRILRRTDYRTDFNVGNQTKLSIR